MRNKRLIYIGALGLLALGCGDLEGRAEELSAGLVSAGAPDTGGTADPAGTNGTDGTGANASNATGEGQDGVDFPVWDVAAWADTPTGTTNSCQSLPDEDADGDGFSVLEGDCNDCDPNVNPGAIEVVVTEPDMMGNIPAPADEDCDGGVDNVAEPCDGAFALDDASAINGAGAIGLCQQTSAGDSAWGVISATYTRANGAALTVPLQHGLQLEFGPNVPPQEGGQLLALSSGYARTPGQPSACGTQSCLASNAGTAPAGFPQDVPACPGLASINDDVALELVIRAPTNATGYAFDFSFYSFEYPEWVCTSFNDQFIAHVTPAPAGSVNGNISFDAATNPVSVNIAFFDVCAGCGLGTAELAGTGFDTWNDAGATSWLTTTAPVEGGTDFTIRFIIWDTGDQAFDSTVLIDNFRFIADGGTVNVGTNPTG